MLMWCHETSLHDHLSFKSRWRCHSTVDVTNPSPTMNWRRAEYLRGSMKVAAFDEWLQSQIIVGFVFGSPGYWRPGACPNGMALIYQFRTHLPEWVDRPDPNRLPCGKHTHIFCIGWLDQVVAFAVHHSAQKTSLGGDSATWTANWTRLPTEETGWRIKPDKILLVLRSTLWFEEISIGESWSQRLWCMIWGRRIFMALIKRCIVDKAILALLVCHMLVFNIGSWLDLWLELQQAIVILRSVSFHSTSWPLKHPGWYTSKLRSW